MDFSWLRALSEMKMPGELSTGGQMPGVPPLGVNSLEGALANVHSREAMADFFGALAWPAKALARVPADAAAARDREALKESVGKPPEQQAADVFKPKLMQPSPLGPDALAAFPLRLVGGMKAYHASPYRFNKFNFEENMGRGEGAQIFTRGGYFAQNPRVMQSYFEDFPPRLQVPSRFSPEIQDELRVLFSEGIDHVRRPISVQDMERFRYEQLNKYADDLRGARRSTYATTEEKKYLEEMVEALQVGTFSTPTKYKVALHTDPTRLLNLDMPSHLQPPAVKRAFENSPAASFFNKAEMELEGVNGGKTVVKGPRSPTGHEAYKALGVLLNSGSPEEAKRMAQFGSREWRRDAATAATRHLRKEGVDGAIYPDELTRNAGSFGDPIPPKGTFNIVTYRDDIIEIKKILNKLGVPAVGIGAILGGLGMGGKQQENVQ